LLRKLSEMENNIFVPKITNIIIPGCTMKTT